MNNKWMNATKSNLNFQGVIKSWSVKDKYLHTSKEGLYKSSDFKNTIQVGNSLMCWLYREKDAKLLRSSWVPLFFQEITKGIIFN